MRLVGAFLVFAAISALGWFRAAAKRRRPQTLLAMADALDVLRIQTCVNLLPMPDALHCAAEEGTSLIKDFYQKLSVQAGNTVPFHNIWENALAEIADLDADDLQSLKWLGARLGCISTEVQCVAMERCISELRKKAEDCAADAKAEGQLSKRLGLACGALLALTLF